MAAGGGDSEKAPSVEVMDTVPRAGKETIQQDGGDIALALLQEQGEIILDKQLRARVLRKVDLFILPLLALTTMLQFMDKSTLSYASIFGIIEDAKLEGSEFSWLGSIFYFGYLCMQPFAAYLMQRFPPAKCLAGSVACWGVILFMHVVCDNFTKLMVVRFILGISESIVTPAFILMSSAWYARDDQPLRMAFWFSFNGVAQIVGGILAYGLGHIKVPGLSSWKWLYFVMGAISIIWAIVLFFFLPDSQLTAKFFSAEEKRAAVEMVRGNNTGIHSKTFKKDQVLEAVLDIKSWVFVTVTFFSNVPNSISTFGSLIIKNFEFDPLATTLLGMPAGGFEFVIMMAIAYVCVKYTNTRVLTVGFAMIVSLLGSVLVLALPYNDKAGLLSGYYLMYAFPTGYILFLSIVSANIAGHTKKVTINAMVMMAFCTGNIVGPQLFKPSQEPRYQLGIGGCVFCFALVVLILGLFRLYLQYENRRRQRMRDELAGSGGDQRLDTGFQDLTDKQNPDFVYVY